MTTLPTTPTREEKFPELPRPAVTFADHSYPAFSKQQMFDFAKLVERNSHSTLTKENARLAERVRVLEGALEPFAKAAEYYDETNGNNGPELESLRLLHGVTVGDLRLARSLTHKDGE